MNAKQIWNNTKFVGRCAKEAGMQVSTIAIGGVIATVAATSVALVAGVDTFVEVSRAVAATCEARMDAFIEREELNTKVVATY